MVLGSWVTGYKKISGGWEKKYVFHIILLSTVIYVHVTYIHMSQSIIIRYI
jgi:hypothetical protein